jgi:hypothetical protein
MERILQEEFQLFQYYHGEDISLLFYSEKEEYLDKLHDLLTLLRPSKISKWLSFDTYYVDYKQGRKRVKQHLTHGYSIWTSIHDLYDDLLDDDIFFLLTHECDFVNKIIARYDVLTKSSSYTKFMGLYRRAYIERKNYFKYLLLFMIVESLIKDDETTGVVFKIRRLCAVLVGTTIEECQTIFDNTKQAYNIRSKLVHSAKNEISSAKYLPFLHSLVCELGIMILISGLDIDKVFAAVNVLGFGQKNTLISQQVFKSKRLLMENRVNLRALTKKK